MEKLRTWLIAERGRGVAMASHLGLPVSFVHKMGTGEKPIPKAHGAAIEQFTGGAVTRREMFPAEWSRIWPELAEQPQPTNAQPMGAEAGGVA